MCWPWGYVKQKKVATATPCCMIYMWNICHGSISGESRWWGRGAGRKGVRGLVAGGRWLVAQPLLGRRKHPETRSCGQWLDLGTVLSTTESCAWKESEARRVWVGIFIGCEWPAVLRVGSRSLSRWPIANGRTQHPFRVLALILLLQGFSFFF